MAVDTRQKRMSMLSFGDGTHMHVTFEADGTVDLDDRQHLLDCYSGIAFATPASSTLLSMERSSFRRIGSRIFGRVN